MHGRALHAVRYAWQAEYRSSVIGQRATHGGRAGRLWDKAGRPAVQQVSRLAVGTGRLPSSTTGEQTGSQNRQVRQTGMQPNSGKIHQYRLLF